VSTFKILKINVYNAIFNEMPVPLSSKVPDVLTKLLLKGFVFIHA